MIAAVRVAVAALRRATAALLDLVWPVDCAGCSRPGSSLCAECKEAFAGPPRRAGLTAWPNSPPVWATAPYRGSSARAVVCWKDRDRRDVGPMLATALAKAVLAVVDERAPPPVGALEGDPTRNDSFPDLPLTGFPLLLIPVPSAGAACRRRGEDVVRVLAGSAARRLRAAGVPVRVAPVLRVARRVADQSGLGASERMNNLHGAFRLRKGAARVTAGRCCLVVDDVVTTGSSVREAARVITAAGGVVRGVAATCATPLLGGLPTGPDLD